MLELDRYGVVERKIIFEAWQSDAFAAPRSRLASGALLGLTAESPVKTEFRVTPPTVNLKPM
jgi:hypothetical protein